MDPNSEKFAAERLVPTDSHSSKATITPTVASKKKLATIVLALIAIAIVIAIAWSPLKERATTAQLSDAPGVNKPPIDTPVDIEPEENVLADDEYTKPVEIVTTILTPKPQLIEPPITLDDSDDQFQLAIVDLAPKLAQWLVPKEQLRKWVMTVDLLADGKLPRRYRPVDFPIEKFVAAVDGDTRQLSDKNFHRMQPIVDTITAMDPSKLAIYYKEWLPILEKAYGELGKKGSFDQRIQTAISQVLDGEQLDSPPVLSRPSVLYQYASESLEQASDVEKILWRMGPENSGKIQFFLRDFRAQLNEQ